MDLTALVQNSVTNHFAEMAIAALWQGVLIAGALAICLRLMPRVSAAYRFAAWAAAYVVLVGLSLFAFVPHLSHSAAGVPADLPGNIVKPLLDLDARWTLAIAGLWILVALIRAVDLAVHSVRLRSLWKEAAPVALDERVAAVLNAAAADCGRVPVEVCTTKALQRPSVIGFFRPRILIPDWLFARLTRGELEQIVLHEAEHLRRRDDWTNLVQKLGLVAFPLNPALAWIERKLCSEREMACDEGVVRVTRAPRAYAACLASLAERGLERRVEALSLGAWQRRPELVHRVHSILRAKAGLNPLGARVLLGTLGCGLLAGSVELAQSPQLVAFVPASTALSASVQSPAMAVNALPTVHAVPAMIREPETSKRGSGFGAVNAAIRIPAGSRIPAETRVPLRQQPAAAATLPQRNSSATSKVNAVPVIARTQPRETNAAQESQWVVLTTWTQVETASAPASGLRSDYDLESASANEAAAMQQGSAPANRITVTQLIFRVLPANAGSNSKASNVPANKNDQAGSKNSSTSQPGLATIHDGWLVLQL